MFGMFREKITKLLKTSKEINCQSCLLQNKLFPELGEILSKTVDCSVAIFLVTQSHKLGLYRDSKDFSCQRKLITPHQKTCMWEIVSDLI